MYIILHYFPGFLKKNETNLKKEFEKKRPDLVEYIVWNSHTKDSGQNGMTGMPLIVSHNNL